MKRIVSIIQQHQFGAHEVNWQEFESEISFEGPKDLKKAGMKEVEER